MLVAQDEVGLEHIGVLQQVAHADGGGDVVRFVVDGVFDEADIRVFIEQLVELLAEVAAHDHDLGNPGGDDGIKERVDDARAVDADERLGGVEGDGHHTAAEARRDEHGALDAVRLKRVEPGLQNHALFAAALFRELLHRLVDGAERDAERFGNFALAHGLL